MFFMSNFSREYVEICKKRFYVTGTIMSLLGVLSLAVPLAASCAIATLAGCVLLFVGIANAVTAFGAFKTKSSPLYPAIIAFISLAAAFGFFRRPIAGVLTISLMLALYFFMSGVVKLVEYFNLRSLDGIMWLLISGILDIILAVIMWRDVFAGAYFIGIILGINLLSGGVALILLGRGCKNYINTRFTNFH